MNSDKHICKNHPQKVANSFCHNCNEYYCSDCLNEGTEYYYCNKKECYGQYLMQKPSNKVYDYFDFPHSDIFSRIIASLIDWLVLGILCTILIVIFDIKLTDENVVLETSIFTLVRHPLFYIVTLLYFTLMESSKKQATIGKLSQKIIVTDLNGGRITILKAFVRNISKFISALPFLMGFIMAEFTKNKQALHDLIAKTLIIKLNNNILPSEILCKECNESITLSLQERMAKEYDCPVCNKKIKINS